MPDLFYPALALLLIGDVWLLIAVIRPYDAKKVARGDRTGDRIGSSPPRPPVG